MSIVRSICAVDINICGPTVQGPAGIGSVGDVVGEGAADDTADYTEICFFQSLKQIPL